MKIKLLAVAAAVLVGAAAGYAQNFKDDKTLSFHERAKLLVSQMTLQEKISQIGNNCGPVNRLGIKRYNYWNEGIHGVARSGIATQFPVSKALSSTWDTDLMLRVGTAISDEARVYNNRDGKGLTYWCPTINMSRDPRWGRDEENYGEDPYLTGTLAVAYIKGMQGDHPKYLKTVATAKHFAANNYERERHSHSSELDDRNLREYYLPAFEMCVKDAKVASVMSAYNAVNGVPCCASPELLTDILRKEWGFKGFVTSDCGAIQDIYDPHHYTSSLEEATAKAIRAGEDMNCGGVFQNNTMGAISQGLLTEADVDSALVRIFEARFALGEFDDDNPWSGISPSIIGSEAHNSLAKEAALKSIVLLKNEAPAAGRKPLLPLDPTMKVALIGPMVNLVSLGGYSGSCPVSTTLLQAFAARHGVTLYDPNNQFEYFDDKHGNCNAEANGCDGNLGNVRPGDWVMYKNVDLGDGCDVLTVRSATANGSDKPTVMKIYIDTKGAVPDATLTLPTTGSWGKYVETVFDVSTDRFKGVHNLYFEFTGGNSYCSNMDWFRFEKYQEPTEATVMCGSFTKSNDGSKMKMESSGNLGYVADGDWAMYEGVNLGNGCDRLTITSASGNKLERTTVEIYLDKIEGTPLARIELPATDGWQAYKDVTHSIDESLFNGRHNLYLKFSGGYVYCDNMLKMRFFNTKTPEAPVEDESGKTLFTERGCNIVDVSATDIDAVKATAAKADVVIFTAGTDLSVMDEGHDRSTIDLPGDQLKVLKAIAEVNPNIILLLQSASSLNVSWANENVPAILEAWYGGQAQGEAIADIIYGDFNPSGKVTSTWYKSDSELPDIKNYDIRAGRRTYMYYNKTPLYPFGHGLSYTTFDYGNLSLTTKTLGKDENVIISFDVTNSGERDGAEIVQLYTHANSAAERPIKELKGFARVELKAGETKTVTMKLHHSDLRWYNPETHYFEVEDGTVDIMIGSSSSDIRLTDSITTRAAQVLATYKSGLSGIGSVTADAAVSDKCIYRLDGVKVESEPDSLASGIYIVDGKKILKK